MFGVVFRTRALHYFVGAGMLSQRRNRRDRTDRPAEYPEALIGSGLIGLGVGSAVTPALFLVGFSLRNANLQRVFAIVELLCFGISAGGTLFGICLYALGRVRPPTPAFSSWPVGEGPAWDSPPLLAAVRDATAGADAPRLLTLIPAADDDVARVSGRGSGAPTATG